jgi:hypothetical protein
VELNQKLINSIDIVTLSWNVVLAPKKFVAVILIECSSSVFNSEAWIDKTAPLTFAMASIAWSSLSLMFSEGIFSHDHDWNGLPADPVEEEASSVRVVVQKLSMDGPYN